VITIDPTGDLIALEERMWRSREARAWRQRVEMLLWNEGNVTDIVAMLVPEGWFVSRGHLRLARRHVWYAVRMMRVRGVRMGFEGFLRMLEPDAFNEAADYLPESRLRRAVDVYRESLTSGDVTRLAGVLKSLRELV
jgi:hypothetical protein